MDELEPDFLDEEKKPPTTTLDLLIATALVGAGLLFIGSGLMRTRGMPVSAKLCKIVQVRGVEMLPPASSSPAPKIDDLPIQKP